MNGLPSRLFHRVDQRRKPRDADFERVFRFDRADTSGSAREDHIARQQGHVHRDKTHDVVAIKNHLPRVRVLTQLPVLEQLNRHVRRINLRLNVGSERRERVERFGARVLALGILDVPVTDVLRRGVAENIARRRGRRDVANLAPDDNGKFRLEVRAMRRMRDFNLPTVRQERG